MRLAVYSTLRHTFDHVYAIVEQLRLRGYDVPLYTSWKGADWATYVPDLAAVAESVDVWLVASSSDAAAVAPTPCVFMEHGAGQAYDADERTAGLSGWSTGTIPNAKLFLCPNRYVAQRRQNRHPNALAIAIGCPRLDTWAHLTGNHEQVERNVAALAFRWDQPRIPETRSAFDHYRPHLMEMAKRLASAGIRPVMTGHPRAAKALRIHAKRTGWEWWESDDVLTSAAVLAFDNTSLGYEFAAVDRPCVVLNAPWYRRDVHHGLRFWECIPGEMADDAREAVAAIARAFEDPLPEVRDCVDTIYPARDGKASWRAAEAISLLL